MRVFNTKTITTFAKTILVLMAVFVVVLGPVGANYVHAQPAPPGSTPPPVQGGGFTHPAQQALARAWNTAGSQAVTVATNVIIDKIIELVVYINAGMMLAIQWAAEVFQGSLEFADTPLREVKAIEAGWTIVRDVSNIFLIFVLLLIAIATILRIESYGARSLLVRLILVALLINFSLVTAQVVVDASNILGRTFIAKIQPVKDKLAATLFIGKLASPTNNLPPNFVGPVQPASSVNQRLQSMTRTVYGEDMAALLERALSDGGQNQYDNQTARLVILLIIFVFLFLAFFVFLALAGLYIIRAAALIIIFVFAPLGFLFLVLPATRSYGMRWWNSLFQWSFFFPASAFLIYLSIMWGSQVAALQIEGNQVTTTALAFHYFLMIVLLLGSIVVARSMGAIGAGAVIGMGIAGRKMITGYVGRGAKSLGLKTTAPLAQGTNRLLGLPGRIPVVGGLFRAAVKPITAPLNAIVRARDKEREDARKKYAGLAGTSGARATYEGIVSPTERRLFREAMVEQGKADLFHNYEMKGDYTRYRKDNNTKAMRGMEAYDPTYAAEGLATKAEQDAAITQAVNRLSADDIRNKMRASAIEHEVVRDAMLLNWSGQKLEAALETFGADLIPARNAAYARLITNSGGEDQAIDKLMSGNKAGLKFQITNPLMATDTSANSMTVKAKRNIDDRNADKIRIAKANARAAVLERHSAAGTSGSPREAAEIVTAEDEAESRVKKIDFN